MFGFFRKKKKDDFAELIPAATEVVGKYGEALEAHNGDISDEALLPYEKQMISNSLLLLLAHEKSREMCDHLSNAYVALGAFQKLTPMESAAAKLAYSTMIDPKSSTEQEIRGMAHILAETGPMLQPIRDRIVEEMTTRRSHLTSTLGKR